MARIPLVTRDAIPEGEREAYDAFMQSRSGRPNVGPYSLILHMPELAQRLEALRLCLRDEASLSQPLQELVMISVAREMNCAFIWYAHAPAARQAGVRAGLAFIHASHDGGSARRSAHRATRSGPCGRPRRSWFARRRRIGPAKSSSSRRTCARTGLCWRRTRG